MVSFIPVPVLPKGPINYHTCKSGCQQRYQIGRQAITIALTVPFTKSRNPWSPVSLHSTGSVDSKGRRNGITPVNYHLVGHKDTRLDGLFPD